MAKVIQKGSFRGIEFEMPSSTEEGQRRLVIHDYPGNGVAIEDMGQGQRLFRITGFLAGRDTKRADDLRLALDDPEPGKLELPWGEDIYAHARQWSIDKSVTRQNLIGFQIQFIEGQAVTSPEAVPDKKGGVLASIRRASDKATAAFSKVYDTVTKPLAVIQSAQAEFSDHLDRLENFRDFLENPLSGVIGEVFSDTLSLAGRIRHLTKPLNGLSVSDLSTMLEGFEATPRAYSAASRTTIGRDEKANALALADYFNQALLLGVAESALASNTIGTTADWAGLRNGLIALGDRILPDGAIAELGAYIASEYESEAGYERVEIKETEPLIVFAHRRYGLSAIENMVEIRSRNQLSHQAFVKRHENLLVPVERRVV